MNVKVFLTVVLLETGLFVSAQTDTSYHGIKFDKDSWQQVRTRAKKEHKYIFVTCGATWCGPCKLMESRVFPNTRVGQFMNASFISVDVQMDTAKGDDERVRSWYSDAVELRKQFKIGAYPSYLFFSPNGEIVHRGIGAKNVDQFLNLAADALNPEKQYNTLLERYKRGKKDPEVMPYLAITSRAIQNIDLANKIGADYIDNYLLKLENKQLYSKKNIEFIKSFTQSSGSKSFSFFYTNGAEIDSVMDKRYSTGIVDIIITKEEIDPKLWDLKTRQPLAEHPDWAGIEGTISRKFSRECADRTVLGAKIRWYHYKNEWDEVVKYDIQKIERYGIDTGDDDSRFDFNNVVWDDIFLHSSDTQVLNKASKWMLMITKDGDPSRPMYMDTYANLLYKCGRVSEAIEAEEKALKVDEADAIKYHRAPDKDIASALNKMRQGEPTWTIN